MKQKIKILIIVLLALLASVFFYALFDSKKDEADILNNLQSIQPKIEQNITKDNEIKNTSQKIIQKAREETAKKISVSLYVLDKEYKASIRDGTTVLGAMNAIAMEKENNFSFKTKDYGDLGSFVSEINKVEGKPGEYWLYYINNKKASLGVSKYVLKDGDSILWKQEAF